MAKHILVYKNKDYPECGGGVFVEEFSADDGQKMHDRVNELANLIGVDFSVVLAGYLSTEFEYTPVEKITKYEPKKI